LERQHFLSPLRFGSGSARQQGLVQLE
jgi:hypothetical protein